MKKEVMEELMARKTMEECIKAVKEEPELPDSMPQEMWDELKKAFEENDRELVEEWCRIIVRATKEGILERFEKNIFSLDIPK